jgi:hypothetical protein
VPGVRIKERGKRSREPSSGCRDLLQAYAKVCALDIFFLLILFAKLKIVSSQTFFYFLDLSLPCFVNDHFGSQGTEKSKQEQTRIGTKATCSWRSKEDAIWC